MAILLLPIGPPGSGKTYLGNLLRYKYKDKFVYLSRDDIFSEIRKTNSIRKSKHLTHEFIKNKIQNQKNKNVIVYIDTTNSNQGIRDLYESYLKPKVVKYLCFKEKNIDILLKRVESRVHPTFPIEKKQQIKTINTIIDIIDYPDENCIEIENFNYNNLFSFLQQYYCKNYYPLV